MKSLRLSNSKTWSDTLLFPVNVQGNQQIPWPQTDRRCPSQIPGTKIFRWPWNGDRESRAEWLMVCRVSFQELISDISTDLSQYAFLCLFTQSLIIEKGLEVCLSPEEAHRSFARTKPHIRTAPEFFSMFSFMKWLFSATQFGNYFLYEGKLTCWIWCVDLVWVERKPQRVKKHTLSKNHTSTMK